MQKCVKLFLLIIFFTVSSFSAAYHKAGFEYIYPPPGAVEVSRHSTVFMRLFDAPPQIIGDLSSVIHLTNEKGEKINGGVRVALDEKTIIFEPDDEFTPGETVHVHLWPKTARGETLAAFAYSFEISDWESTIISRDEPQESLQKTAKTFGEPTVLGNGVSVPSDFPLIDVTVNDNPSPGFIFLNNWGGYPYTMMLDNSGEPVWYVRGQNDGDRRRDFKVQDSGILTMRVLGAAGYDFGDGFIGLDSTYSFIRGFHADQGYGTDEHELQVLENGNYLLIALRGVTVDMSKIVAGGKKDARFSESGIQEFTADGDLIFHWRALDNFDPIDMFGYTDESPTSSSFRFTHMNSIDIDDDGHIILSSKRLSEVTKIHRQTGEFLWRLGGANNEFEFVNDPLNGFSLQHSVRALGNGHYTIFDNGVNHDPQLSRALEYKINTDDMTATLVWSFQRDKPNDYAFHMGNVQRLENGNTFINWAVQNMPKAQEVTPDGETVYEMNFSESAKSYRAFRFPWHGVAEKPTLFVEQHIDHLALIFNKFGDADVDHYNIYVGRGSNPTEVYAASATSMAKLYDLENRRRYFARVTAVDSQGNESDFSNQEQFVVNMMTPGSEMVSNGDFSNGKESWDWLVRNGAQATWSIQNDAAVINISNGSANDHDIQLTQAGITLVRGRDYLFEFDARADAPRTIEAKIAQNGGSFINYSGLGVTALVRSSKRYQYQFTMNDATADDARIVFNLGGHSANVHISNVSVKMLGETVVSESETRAATFELAGNYPNPFNAETIIQFSLPGQHHVKLELYNSLGQFERTITDKVFAKGNHSVKFDAYDLTSGVYFCRMTTNTNNFVDVHKLILMK